VRIRPEGLLYDVESERDLLATAESIVMVRTHSSIISRRSFVAVRAEKSREIAMVPTTSLSH